MLATRYRRSRGSIGKTQPLLTQHRRWRSRLRLLRRLLQFQKWLPRLSKTRRQTQQLHLPSVPLKRWQPNGPLDPLLHLRTRLIPIIRREANQIVRLAAAHVDDFSRKALKQHDTFAGEILFRP